MKFTPKKLLILHSQQPSNQYAGGGTGVADSEQHWMRLLALEVYDLVKATGHDVRLCPLGRSYADNVAWVQRPENRDADELWSLHSNATATAGDAQVGIGVYHHPASKQGAAIAKKLAVLLGKAAATGKSYTATIEVAEVANTTPPAVLIEHEFHDHDDTRPGGADWIRDPKNRTAIARAYLAYVVGNYGQATTEPEEETPVVKGDEFRFASYNVQLPQFAGGPVGDDVAFIKGVLCPSILACQEVNERYRQAIEAQAGFNYYTGKTLLLGWLPKKWRQGEIIKGLLDTPYHGVVGTELHSLENGRSLVAASGHGLPTDAFPKSWSKEKVLKEKLDAIRGMIDVLDGHDRVVVGGDWNVPDVRSVFLAKGYRLASPFISTVDGSGNKRYDLVFVKGLEVRTSGSVHPTKASDHHGVVANLTLPGKAMP